MDTALLAQHAQRILAGLDLRALARIRAHVYRDRPDFTALEGVERAYVPGQPPPSPPAGTWLAYVFSKPSIVDGEVHVHVLEHENARGETELWLKLKRAESLRELFAEATPVANPGAAFQRFVLEQAGSSATSTRCDDDLAIVDGPTWLRTHPSIAHEGSVTALRMPTTQTPLDAPPRFAGLHYVKALRFSWR